MEGKVSPEEGQRMVDEMHDEYSRAAVVRLLKVYPDYFANTEPTVLVNSVLLDPIQATLVDDLLQNGLAQDVGRPSGLDGHSFELTLYRQEPEQFRCWCYLPAEWEKLKRLINMLVNDIAELDFVHYGAN